MDALLNALQYECERLGAHRTYWIALSGGLDSAVLLYLAAQLPAYSFHVIHVHHGIHPLADEWALFCETQAKQYQLPFYCERVSVMPLAVGESLEAKARELRYAAFKKQMNSGDVIVTAHHQNDQAETLLLQLTRGAGIAGLAAMPISKAWQDGFLLRPLLSLTRDVLAAYAHEHRLSFIHDDSNDELKYTRNFLRHAVMPVLKTRWPSIENTMARSASHCAEAKIVMSELLQEKLMSVRGNVENTLSVSALNLLTPVLQKALLRAWMEEAGYKMPESKKLNTVLANVLTARWDKQACVTVGEVRIRRHRDLVYLVPLISSRLNSYLWAFTEPLALAGWGSLQASLQVGGVLSPLVRQLEVRFRQGGETLQLRGRGRQCLKKLWQVAGVPPWERERVPLFYVGEELAMVWGLGVAEGYEALAGEEGWSIARSRL